jgi:anti-anti-sigma factor
MNIKESQRGRVCALTLEGRVDSNTAPVLERRLLGLIDSEKKDFLIDFNLVDYISSAGLRVLLMAAKKSKAMGGKVALCALKDTVREVFDLSGFTTIFPVFSSADEAARSF